MSKDSFDQYANFLRALHNLENDSVEADLIRDEMDPLWGDMTDEERINAWELSASLEKGSS